MEKDSIGVFGEMKRLKGLGARRSSFEIPKLKKISQVVGIYSPRNSEAAMENRRSADERRDSGAAEACTESKEIFSVESQQVSKSSLRGIASRRSSFSSSSDFQSSSSSRPSDAGSVNYSATSSDAFCEHGRNTEQGRAIVVAFDANARDALVGAVTWAFLHVLTTGDVLVLVGVIDFIRGPLGYKCQVNDQTWLGANRKQLQDEIALKKLAWSTTRGLKKLCEERGVKLVVDVKPALRFEIAIVQEAIALGAVQVVLDKSLNNRRRKYYLERLTCDVTRMRRSGGVEVLRSTAKEISASPTSVIPPSESLNQPSTSAVPALNPSASLYRADDEELFTIDHCVSIRMDKHRHSARMSIDDGYETDDLFSISGDGEWRTSSLNIDALAHPIGLVLHGRSP